MATESAWAHLQGKARKYSKGRRDEEHLLHSSARSSGECLEDESLERLQPPSSGEFRQLFSELRSHQESFFRQVLDQQKDLRAQLLVMNSASKEAADLQAAFTTRHEDFIAEFNKFSCKFQSTDTDTTSHQLITTAQQNVALGQSRMEASVGTDDSASTDDLSKPAPNPAPDDTEISIDLPHSPSIQPESQLIGNAESAIKLQHYLNGEQKITTDKCEKHVRISSGDSHKTNDVVRSESFKSCKSPKSMCSFGERNSFIRSQDFRSQESFGPTKTGGELRAKVSRVLKKKEFEVAVAFAIMANALIMCWESQYVGLDVGFELQYPGRPTQAHTVWPGAEVTFALFDWVFGLLFVIEMVVKIVCFRSTYFYDSRGLDPEVVYTKCSRFFRGLQGWNMLDFHCVLAFLFDKMAGGSGSVNPQMLRLLRLFRLFRLVRLLRFLESLDHLYVMTTAIAGLSSVLLWAIVLLTIMLLTCNLFVVQILQATYFDQVTVSDLKPEQLTKHHEMYAYFGTCTRCMLTMFEITLGNWPPVARLLSEEVSEWFTLVCLVHKLTIGFAVIGVINAVILQETFQVAATDDIIMFRRKRKAGNILRKKLERLFNELDESGDGKLDIDEFVAIGEDPEIKIWLSSLDVDTDGLTTLFDLLDTNGNGYVTLDELVRRMPRIKGTARSVDMLSIKKSFDKHFEIQRQIT